MRRLTRVAALGVIAVVALGACAQPVPAGVDRNMADEWPKFAEPKLKIPTAGSCSSSSTKYVEDLGLEQLGLLDSCTGPHVSETFHVGTFTGAAANRPATPSSTADMTQAWTDCGAVAKEFLGDDWRTARLRMIVLVPSATHWSAGARWFRCELIGVKSEYGEIVERSGSAKDGLRGNRPAGIACSNMVNETKDSFQDLADVACTQPHRTEFAGVAVTSVAEYPDSDDKGEKAFAALCVGMVAQYLGMTRAEFSRHQQFNLAYWIVSKDRWELGDRSASCYATTVKPVSVSVRGYGNRRLP